MKETDLWRIGAAACTPRQWEAIVLVYGEGLTHRQAGLRMNISEQAAANLVNRGLRRIRKETRRCRSCLAAGTETSSKPTTTT